MKPQMKFSPCAYPNAGLWIEYASSSWRSCACIAGVLNSSSSGKVRWMSLSISRSTSLFSGLITGAPVDAEVLRGRSSGRSARGDVHEEARALPSVASTSVPSKLVIEGTARPDRSACARDSHWAHRPGSAAVWFTWAFWSPRTCDIDCRWVDSEADGDETVTGSPTNVTPLFATTRLGLPGGKMAFDPSVQHGSEHTFC